MFLTRTLYHVQNSGTITSQNCEWIVNNKQKNKEKKKTTKSAAANFLLACVGHRDWCTPSHRPISMDIQCGCWYCSFVPPLSLPLSLVSLSLSLSLTLSVFLSLLLCWIEVTFFLSLWLLNFLLFIHLYSLFACPRFSVTRKNCQMSIKVALKWFH